MRLILCGNFGVGNFGDEALHQAFLQHLSHHHCITLSAHPRNSKELPRLPFGVRSLLSTPWWKTIRGIAKADALIFAGGSLFTDAESIKAPLLWGFHALVAKILGTPIIIAHGGIGPLQSGVGRRMAAMVLRQSRHTSVRDERSKVLAESIAPRRAVIQSADPVLELFWKLQPPATGSTIAVIPRGNAAQKFVREAMRECQQRNAGKIRILLLQPADAKEMDIAQSVRSQLAPLHCEILPILSINDLHAALAGCNFVISQRYHGALAALSWNIPVLAVSQAEGDKLSSVAKLGNREALEQRLKRSWDALLEALRKISED